MCSNDLSDRLSGSGDSVTSAERARFARFLVDSGMLDELLKCPRNDRVSRRSVTRHLFSPAVWTVIRVAQPGKLVEADVTTDIAAKD
jgi:uncharacterized C2H2 Zn-finger protein